MPAAMPLHFKNLHHFGFLAPKDFYYFALQSFDWALFQKRAVHTKLHIFIFIFLITDNWGGDGRGHDRMVVGYTTTYAINAYHHWSCEFESWSGRGVQHYVIKFDSDLRQVGGFLRVLRFPLPIKLTATI
jgi:hypothetical protein